ncbi:site-specific integrase [Clavibacter michiganensis]|uniref:Site-specific tyrosine recombinase XerC n=1 Tax=Clavibacter michiganensis TaxID=28447 RepID=A0A251YMN6_9MICO|nr:tyrosine-type recombinase/integrase [Clavibacter michiganensis]OUE25507.1 site-specific tyrosine recombinase XerC [Clavibacter michiganensis]
MARPRTPISAHGAISVVEVEKGKWRARTRYRFDDGRLRQVERFASSQSKARTALLTALVDLEAPSTSEIRSSTTLAQLAARYLEWKAVDGVAQRTIDTYRWAVGTVIAPASSAAGGIGDLTLREATTERLDRFLTAVGRDRGNGAAKTCKSVLSGMLGYAARLGAIRTNPVREVGRIARKNEGATAVTLEGMPALLAAVRADDRMRALDMVDLIQFLAGTGARVSEALALQWDAVDAAAKTVEITRNVVRVRGEGMKLQDHTKTTAGMRVIGIPDHLVQLLEQRRREQPTNELGLVFPSVLGKLRDPSNTLKDWRLNRDRLGAPDTSFHSFRKYVATALDSAGLSAREIAEYLGHRRPSLTQDTYMSRKVGGTRAAGALDQALQ